MKHAHRVAWQLDVDHEQRRNLLVSGQVRLVRHVWRGGQQHMLCYMTQLEIKCVQVGRYEPASSQNECSQCIGRQQPTTG